MKKIILNNIVLAVAALLAAGTYSFAQTPATPEQRLAVEAEYGVKDAVVKYDTRSEMMADKNLLGGEYYLVGSEMCIRDSSCPEGLQAGIYQPHRPSRSQVRPRRWRL